MLFLRRTLVLQCLWHLKMWACCKIALKCCTIRNLLPFKYFFTIYNGQYYLHPLNVFRGYGKQVV